MRKFVKMMILALPMLCINVAFAQEENGPEGEPNMTPEQIAEKKTARMKEELSLTADQEKQIYDINLAHATQMKQYREEMRILKEKTKAEKESTRTKIKAVLTPEQNVIFDQKAEEMKERQEKHRDKPHGDD